MWPFFQLNVKSPPVGGLLIQQAPTSMCAMYIKFFNSLPQDRVNRSVRDASMHELVFVSDVN